MNSKSKIFISHRPILLIFWKTEYIVKISKFWNISLAGFRSVVRIISKNELIFLIKTSVLANVCCQFCCQEIFWRKFNMKKGCKNEFNDNTENSCSWFRNIILIFVKSSTHSFSGPLKTNFMEIFLNKISKNFAFLSSGYFFEGCAILILPLQLRLKRRGIFPLIKSW